jgi:hypothetical protein
LREVVALAEELNFTRAAESGVQLERRFETLPALGHALPLDWTIPAPSK